MANVAFLKIEGVTQGLITSGCNTQDSLGNKHQSQHSDEIMVLSCSHNINAGEGTTHDPLVITKNIDKASPLLAIALNKAEHLNCVIDFYRTNSAGGNEKFYTIELLQAKIVNTSFYMPHTINQNDDEMEEEIAFTYKDIKWLHHTAGTSGYALWKEESS